MHTTRRIPLDGSVEVLDRQTAISYPSVTRSLLPERPDPTIRTVGFFKRPYQPDQAHADRLWDIYHITVETEMAERAAQHAEVEGIRAAIEGAQQLEIMVLSLPPNGVPALLGADMASDAIGRSRVRHARHMDNFDTHALNLRRR